MNGGNGNSNKDQGPKLSILTKPLEDPNEFNTWAYILGGSFELENETADIFGGEVRIYEDDGKTVVMRGSVVLEAEEALKYKRAEIRMKLTVIRHLSSRYNSLPLTMKRFKDMWEYVDNNCRGDKKVKLVDVTARLQNMRWKGSFSQLLAHFNALHTEYQMLGGEMAENELTGCC